MSLVEQLRTDLGELQTALHDLSSQNDELFRARDADEATIRNLDSQVQEYKRKYEQAKTELRSVKGTTALFSMIFQYSHSLVRSHFAIVPSCPKTRWSNARVC